MLVAIALGLIVGGFGLAGGIMKSAVSQEDFSGGIAIAQAFAAVLYMAGFILLIVWAI